MKTYTTGKELQNAGMHDIALAYNTYFVGNDVDIPFGSIHENHGGRNLLKLLKALGNKLNDTQCKDLQSLIWDMVELILQHQFSNLDVRRLTLALLDSARRCNDDAVSTDIYKIAYTKVYTKATELMKAPIEEVSFGDFDVLMMLLNITTPNTSHVLSTVDMLSSIAAFDMVNTIDIYSISSKKIKLLLSSWETSTTNP